MHTTLDATTMPAAPTAAAVPNVSFDHAAAAKEGWAVVDCGLSFEGAPQAQLQRFDELPEGKPVSPLHGLIAEDRDAWIYVAARARAGSELHRAALGAVGDVERMLIEAIASGDPSVKQPVAQPPEGGGAW